VWIRERKGGETNKEGKGKKREGKNRKCQVGRGGKK
jgi:hypothetical protein